MISFTLEDNEGIRKFFEGDDSCIPISEYRYLHDRPLLRPNFLTQIDDLTKTVADKIARNNMKNGIPVEKFIELAITIGQNLDGELTDPKIEIILKTLRNVRNLCTGLNKKLK